MLTKKCEVCGAKISRKSKICPYCNEKPNKASVAAIRTFLLWLVLMIVIGTVLFSSESAESNEIFFSPPTWYIPACYIIPAIAAVLKINSTKNRKAKKNGRPIFKKITQPVGRWIKLKYQAAVNPNNEFRVPRSKERQRKLAADLLDSANADKDLANKSDSIGMFILWYDDLLQIFEKIAMLERAGVREQATRDLTRLKSEMQWHMCDALDRQKETVIADIKGKYRNSREFQKKQYEAFKNDIEEARPRFSVETYEFAMKCLREVEEILGLSTEANDKSKMIPLSYSEITDIDCMDGHEFEYWCADLLRKIGFQNVEVTQGSGDQGVDILAIKDGIKYAIQCKCYSSDLGNKPIQEINTGKMIYHCQIGAVMTNRHFTAGGKAAAQATGVLLWDRDWIQVALESISAQKGAHP